MIYMCAGIDCVAITDHNSGEWIDCVKEELVLLNSERPEGFRPIHVFPGVEISVNGGIHLLAILGCDKKTSDIDSLLGAVEFDTAKRVLVACALVRLCCSKITTSVSRKNLSKDSSRRGNFG